MAKYEVLWLDDEYEKLSLKREAETHGINIDGVKSSEEFKKVLEQKINHYHAIILDARSYKFSDQVEGTEDLSAFSDAHSFINELKSERVIPYFVLTGQADIEDKGQFFEMFGDIKRIHKKGRDEQDLLKRIKKAANEIDLHQIKHRYSEVFQILSDYEFGEQTKENIIDILLNIEKTDFLVKDHLYFNQLRIALEELFRSANKKGLLHDKCIQGHDRAVTISLSNRFLSGKSVDVLGIECTKTHFPAIIQDHVNDIIHITNIASHSESDEKEKSEKNLTEYRQTVNTPYLLYGLTFKLLDVLIWFKRYVDHNNDIEANKSLWEDISSEVKKKLSGKVINKNPKGFAFLEPPNAIDSSENIFIPPQLVSKHDLTNGAEISITVGGGRNGEEAKSVEILN